MQTQSSTPPELDDQVIKMISPSKLQPLPDFASEPPIEQPVPEFLTKPRPNGKAFPRQEHGTALPQPATREQPDEEKTLGQAILDGTIDKGRTVLIHEVGHLRAALARKYPVIGWFRRFLLNVIGVQDPTVLLNELGTMREQGALALKDLGHEIENLKFQLIESEQATTQACDAIDAFTERDALRQHVAELKQALAAQDADHQNAISKLKVDHATALNAKTKAFVDYKTVAESTVDSLNREVAELNHEIQDRNKWIDELESRLRRIDEQASLLTLTEAFAAAASGGSARKVKSAIKRLEEAQSEIEKLVTTDAFQEDEVDTLED